MNVVFISSEIVPFASTGGLSDVAAALPRTLEGLGAKVTRIMPMYRQVIEGRYQLKSADLKLEIPVGMSKLRGEVLYTDDYSPRTYFIRRDEFFDRSGLYGTVDSDYDDNCDRFIFFQKAAVELIDQLGLAPDIVHCNDWQTGLIPLLLKHGAMGMGRTGRERSIFTIHNIAYQGLFPSSEFPSTGLPFSCFSIGVMEFYGDMSWLKAGITTSDRITTVSESYAQEIQTEEQGYGMEGILKSVSDRLVGIPNGADYSVWDPRTDAALVQNYSASDLSGKASCKRDLIESMKLDIDLKTPLIGMVTRLADQKGVDILAEAMEKIMDMKVGFVLLGTGRQKYHEQCQAWARKWPDRFAVRLEFDPELSRRIEGGADIFLMPSKYEPCGLNQLYSLRYGTIPVVHATGGLKDTITDLNPNGTRGTGIQFDDYSAASLLEGIKRALKLYHKNDTWPKIQRRAMKQDFSWRRSAKSYMDLYQEINQGA